MLEGLLFVYILGIIYFVAWGAITRSENVAKRSKKVGAQVILLSPLWPVAAALLVAVGVLLGIPYALWKLVQGIGHLFRDAFSRT